MPTTRTPIGRSQRVRITPAVKALYARIGELELHYHARIRGGQCRAAGQHEHCPECAEYLDSSVELSRLLGLMPWEITPDEAATAKPPDYIARDAWKAKEWRHAYALRRKLEERS